MNENNKKPSKDLILPGIVPSLFNFKAGLHKLASFLSTGSYSVTICTIYNKIPGLSEHEKIALSLFNNIIIEEAIEWGFSILDLRTVCNEEQDCSTTSPIEPSEVGGLKIAYSIREIIDKKSGVRANIIFSGRE